MYVCTYALCPHIYVLIYINIGCRFAQCPPQVHDGQNSLAR